MNTPGPQSLDKPCQGAVCRYLHSQTLPLRHDPAIQRKSIAKKIKIERISLVI